MERGRWGESCCRGLVWSFYEVHPLHSRQALNGHTIIQVGRACEKGCEPERKWRSPCRTLPQHLVASPDNKAKDFQSCNSDIYFDRVKGKTGECVGVSHPIVPKVFHSFFPFHPFILLPFQKGSWYHTQTARKGRSKIKKTI